MSNELIAVEDVKAIDVFTLDGIDPLINRIKEEVGKFVADATTKEGRAQIKSMAYKVSQTKSYLKGLGKDLKSDWVAKAKVVTGAVSKVEKELDELRDTVRAPLTKFEEVEKARVEQLETRLANLKRWLNSDHYQGADSQDMRVSFEKLQNIAIDNSWQEYEDAAATAKISAVSLWKTALADREQQEKDQAELDVLRKEKEARDKKDHEDKLKREAALAATKEAEQKAEKEKERIENEKQAAIDAERAAEERAERAEADKVMAEGKAAKEKADAEVAQREAAEKAEQEKKDAAAHAKRERQWAESRRLNDVEKAKEEERRKFAAEEEKKKQAEIKRQADQEHKVKIDGEISAALMDNYDIPLDACFELIALLSSGKVPHIKIQY